jgi:hypothetical protein
MDLKNKCLWAITISALVTPALAHAETDPRDYEALVALPNNTAVAVGYYRHISAASAQSYSADLALFRGAYILRFGNLSVAPVDVVLPVADEAIYVPAAAGSPASLTVHAAGLGDFLYFPTVGYLIPQDEINHTYIAFTPYFSFPTGQYDPTHPVNIGTHRAYFEQELAVGQRFLKIVNLELIGNVTEYLDNSSFDTAAGTSVVQGTLQQKATLGGVFHASVDVSQSLYFAASFYVTAYGQESFVYAPASINAVAVNQQTVETLRFGMGIRLEPRTLLLLQYNQDVGESNGAPITQFIGARISHLF